MTIDNEQNLYIREINEFDNVKNLSLGNKELTALKSFLEKDALNFHFANIVKTYVLTEHCDKPGKIWGYISLMCSELELTYDRKPTESKRMKRYDVFPAVKLARLAIDKTLQGKGYGKQLLDTVIARIKLQIMPVIGCRYLIVDSKRNAIGFYEKKWIHFT